MSTPLAQLLLMYFLAPLWIAAGFSDWVFHRKSDIEHTAGTKESLMHFLMFLELGIPLFAVLFLEVNALVILVMIVALLVHEATTYWDVNYAGRTRRVSAGEQMVHSVMEMLPVMGLCLLAVLNEAQFLALFGLGGEAARFELRPKSPPLPPAYLAGFVVATTVFTVLPFVNELWRCLRASRTGPTSARRA